MAAADRGQLRELWRIRDFRVLLLSRLVSNLGNGITPVALSFGVLGLEGGNGRSLSIVNGAHMVALVVFMLVGGVVADRFGRCRTVGGSDIIGSFIVGTAAWLLISGRATVLLLATTGFLLGALHAMWQPAYRGILPMMVPREMLQAANAANGIIANSTYLLGAAIAGVLVSAFGSGWAIMVDAVSFLVAGVLVWGLRHLDERVVTDRSQSMLVQLREGWQEFVSRQWLVVTVVSMSLFFLAFEAFQAVIAPVQMKEALGGARDLGFMMAAWGAGGFIGMSAAVRLRPKRPMLAAWSIMPVHAAWMFALAVPAPLPVLMLAAVVSGMAIDLSFTWFGTTLQTQVPEDVISRVGSFDALGAALFGPVGLVFAGPLVDSIGASKTSTIAGVVALVSGAAPLVFASVRRLESVV